MQESKLETISNLFENSEIRSIWNKDEEEYYFSVVDIISALTGSSRSRKYWNDLKIKLKNEGSELSENIGQLKMKSFKDGKFYMTDVLDTKGIFRLIESIPSPKAEPFKLWLANLGKERIDEVFDPEVAVNRAVIYYRSKGYSDDWIKRRIIGIIDRFKLTDTWKDGGVSNPLEYALLTNEIYKTWSGMKASDYKNYKGLRKESLRDNMTPIELALTNLGEIAASDIAKMEQPKGLTENMSVAKRGGSVAKGARDLYESETKLSAVSNDNYLNYKYKDEVLSIDNK